MGYKLTPRAANIVGRYLTIQASKNGSRGSVSMSCPLCCVALALAQARHTPRGPKLAAACPSQLYQRATHDCSFAHATPALLQNLGPAADSSTALMLTEVQVYGVGVDSYYPTTLVPTAWPETLRMDATVLVESEGPDDSLSRWLGYTNQVWARAGAGCGCGVRVLEARNALGDMSPVHGSHILIKLNSLRKD